MKGEDVRWLRLQAQDLVAETAHKGRERGREQRRKDSTINPSKSRPPRSLAIIQGGAAYLGEIEAADVLFRNIDQGDSGGRLGVEAARGRPVTAACLLWRAAIPVSAIVLTLHAPDRFWDGVCGLSFMVIKKKKKKKKKTRQRVCTALPAAQSYLARHFRQPVPRHEAKQTCQQRSLAKHTRLYARKSSRNKIQIPGRHAFSPCRHL